MAQTRTDVRKTTSLHYPKRYNVVILNDDATPVDFVIQLLVDIFNKTIADAKALTMQVHEHGKGIAGTYSKELAEQKHVEATLASRTAGYPLRIKLEEA